MPALKSAICLRERHAQHPKTAPSLLRLFKKWLSMTDEQKLAACTNDSRILAVITSEVSALGCPGSEAGLQAFWESNKVSAPGSDQLAVEYEAFKLGRDGIAVQAKSPQEQAAALTTRMGEQQEAAHNVWLAVRVHRILEKSGVAALDSGFKAKAKEVYPNSTYFAAL